MQRLLPSQVAAHYTVALIPEEFVLSILLPARHPTTGLATPVFIDIAATDTPWPIGETPRS